jgi:hypothetical protein
MTGLELDFIWGYISRIKRRCIGESCRGDHTTQIYLAGFFNFIDHGPKYSNFGFWLYIDNTKVLPGVASCIGEIRRPYREIICRGDDITWGRRAGIPDFVDPGPRCSTNGEQVFLIRLWLSK